MRLTVLKIQEQKSKYGKTFYYIFLKDDVVGKSYRTCAYPAYGNWRRCGWDRVVSAGLGAILEYNSLPINMKGLLDADIAFKLLPKEAANENSPVSR